MKKTRRNNTKIHVALFKLDYAARHRVPRLIYSETEKRVSLEFPRKKKKNYKRPNTGIKYIV